MSRRFAIEWLLPVGLLGLVTWLVWFTYHDLLRSYDYVNILGDHFFFLRDRLLRGEIPWWNPYIALGRPFFTDIHFGTLYPPTYLVLLGERVGCFLIHWSHLVLLFAGVRRVARELDIAPELGTIIAGFAGLTGSFAARMMIGQILFTCALCWLPWFLFFVLRLQTRWSWPTVSGLTIALAGSFLGGNTNVWWVLCIGAGLTFFFRELFEGMDGIWPRARGRALQFGAALLFAIGLTTPAWLPYLDLVEHANRMASTYEFANAFTARPADLVSLFAAPSSEAPFNWERCFFVGALWLVAAVCGAATTRDARLRAIAATTVFALLYSLGEHTPLHRLCYHALPGAAGFRVPSRMAPWACLGLLLLGASFLSRPASLRRTLPPVLTTIALAVGGLFLAAGIKEDPMDALNAVTLTQLAVAGLIVSLAANWVTRPRLLPTIVTVVTLVECGVFLAGTKPLYTFAGVMGSKPDFPFQKELSRLPEALGIQPDQPPPRANLPGDLTPPNAGMRHRVAMLNGDAPLFLERPWRYLHALTGTPPSDVYRNTLPTAITTRPANALPLVTLNLARSPTGSGFTAAPDSFPRAYLATSVRTMPDEDGVVQAFASGFPFTRGVLAEGETNADFGDLDNEIQPIPIQRFENNRLRIAFTNEVPAYLVLSEAWFPGWTARDGNRVIPAEPVNLWMRGFRLPPGEHRLEIGFRPRRFALGWLIAIATLFALVAAKRSLPVGTEEPSP